MNAPPKHGQKAADMGTPTKQLMPTTANSGVQTIDLSRLGFSGHVSPAALEEIERNEARAGLVLTTAAKFAFR